MVLPQCNTNSPEESSTALPNAATAETWKFDVDSTISDIHCQRLFRLFLFFAGNQLFWRPPGGRLLRFIRHTQAQFLLCQMCQIRDQMQISPDRPLPSIHSEEDVQLGLGVESREYEAVCLQPPNCCDEEFVTFRALLQRIRSLLPLQRQFESLVDRLFSRYVLQLIRKGFLLGRKVVSWSRQPSHSSLVNKFDRWQQKRLKSLASFRPLRRKIGWHTFWCILMPGQLHLSIVQGNFSSNGTNSRNNSIGKMAVKLRRDNFLEYAVDGENDAGGVKALFGWLLVTADGVFEFAHFDQLQRQFWIADTELAIRKRNPSLLCHFDRSNSLNQNAEKSATRELEEALEMERRALRDEECVRQLATRMLDEEVLKGERLRRKVQLLQEELETEKRQRVAMEHRCFIEEWPDAENVEAPSHGKSHRTSIKEGDPSEKVAQYADNDQQREGTFPSSAAIRPITPMARTKRGKRFRDELTNRMRKREEEAEEKIKEDQEREEEAEEKIKEDQEREEEAEENIKEDQEREEEAEENIKEDQEREEEAEENIKEAQERGEEGEKERKRVQQKNKEDGNLISRSWNKERDTIGQNEENEKLEQHNNGKWKARHERQWSNGRVGAVKDADHLHVIRVDH